MSSNENGDEKVRSILDHSPRVAFCALLAIGGAALVTKGADLTGFIWWFLIVFLLGTLLEGDVSYEKLKRLKFSTIVGVCFIATLAGLLILTGVGPSRFTPNSENIGVNFSRIPERLELFLSPVYAGVFTFIGVATVFGIYLASLASSHTMELLRQWKNVPDEGINRFKKRYRVTVSVLLGVSGMVAYFAF